MKQVELFVDGAAEPNPGKGGWGAVLKYGGALKKLYGGVENVTNNAMEITAAIEGLKALKEPCQVTLYSDSQYLVNTMTRGWNRKTNHDLWDQLDALVEVHQVTFQWVRGHNGNPGNEMAHELSMKGVYRR